MDEFPEDLRGGRPPPRAPAETEDDDFMQEIHDNARPDAVITRAPKPPFRLGFWSVAALPVNRMIGTGIFNSPEKVIAYTQSPGIALLFWFFGIIYCMAGVYVYVEFGLNVPRYVINGVERSVARSGADLNYLQYVYTCLKYKKDTVIFMGCLFGISFILIGNMASNCISFGLLVLQAADPDKPVEDHSPAAIRFIALLIAFVTCFIHAVSRRGGILLNNLFALVKIIILIFIPITAILFATGTFPREDDIDEPLDRVIKNNTSPVTAFDNPSKSGYNYAQALLSIIFAISGFDQPNYVLGEIRRPRHTFPNAAFLGAFTVCVLYMIVNISYMVVVPAEIQRQGNVAQTFFRKTYGQLGGSSTTGMRVFNAFLAISSFGNIVVMTYTAARMKQEIAKQGFLPWAKFFARNYDMSLGRSLEWLERKKGIRIPFLDPSQHKERTPVGALMLHMATCAILIFSTWRLTGEQAYTILSNFISYIPSAFFGFFLALGILLLHWRGPPNVNVPPDGTKLPSSKKRTWANMTQGTIKFRWLSQLCAIIYLVGNGVPLVMVWVHLESSQDSQLGYSWYVPYVICCCVLLFSALWWFGFIGYAKYRKNEYFVYEVEPRFEWAGGDGRGDAENLGRNKGQGELILVSETVYLYWRAKEMSAGMDRLGEVPGGNQAQADFDQLDERMGQAQGQGIAGAQYYGNGPDADEEYFAQARRR